jgi:periplasmic divalent cation tolerance protein
VTKNNPIVVFITAGSYDESKKISELLLNKRKAACVNIIPRVGSAFWWEGRIDSAEESLLIVKSTESALQDIIELVRQIHSYEIPEIIALPVIGGSEHYLKWIDAEVR